MASILSSLDSLVEGLVISSNFPEYGSIIFFLLFFIIFSISFASMAFLPMFKDDKTNNIRVIISLSIALLSSIYFFDYLKGAIIFFGMWMLLSFVSSFAIIAVIPKDARESVSRKVAVITLIAGLIISLIIYFSFGNELAGFFSSIPSWFR